jgi:stage II sporulation protein D
MRIGIVLLAAGALMAQTPTGVPDAWLDEASGGRTIRLGSLATGQVARLPLERYVATVLAGEADPRAADGSQEALAVAIRTYAIANPGRHEAEGFDLCDTTHCQVPRAATPASRRATLATAGRILVYEGQPAPVFYSASCGGRSERAENVWPGPAYPYLQSVPDDVHDGDEPWAAELGLDEIHAALARQGFEGERLTDLVIEERNESGRVQRLGLPGLRPASIDGNAFRLAVGATLVRSTAFELDRAPDVVTLTGRGYGHGVGMCVVGAGRRALRGETVETILGHYYPGLALAPLDDVLVR